MPNRELRDLLKSVAKLPVVPETITETLEDKGIQLNGDQPFKVTGVEKSVTKLFENIVAFDPNVSNLFPGNLVQGKDAITGNLNRLPGKRAPITITLTGLISSDTNVVYSKEIEEPKLSTFTAAYSQLITQNFNYTNPANFSYYATEFESKEQASLAIGASAKWINGDIDARLFSHVTASTSNLIVRFVQKYFTISIDELDYAEDFFHESVVPIDLKDEVVDGNPPLYISDVHYGRELILVFSIEQQNSSVLAQLKASFSAFGGSGQISITAEDEAAIRQTKTMLLVKGGDARDALKIIDGETLGDKKTYILDFLFQGAYFNRSSMAAPISYVLKYISDKTLFSVNSSAVFRTTSQTPILSLKSVHVHFHTHGDDKDPDEGVEMWFYRDGILVGNLLTGQGQKWRDHTDQHFDIDIRPMVMKGQNLLYRLRKHPDGGTGSGWRMSMNVLGRLTDGTQRTLVDWGERLVGDGNQYDFTVQFSTEW